MCTVAVFRRSIDPIRYRFSKGNHSQTAILDYGIDFGPSSRRTPWLQAGKSRGVAGDLWENDQIEHCPGLAIGVTQGSAASRCSQSPLEGFFWLAKENVPMRIERNGDFCLNVNRLSILG
jgi:hypothetical protein